MKRILFLVIGYYLVIQSAIATLNALGKPELLLPAGAIAALSGWGGHELIKRARAMKPPIENAPTKELPVPETQPLPKP